MYTGISGNEFSFDVIVDKTERGKGIGKKLIDFGLSEYNQLSDDYTIKLDVVNNNLINHLKKRGLKVVQQFSGRSIMTF